MTDSLSSSLNDCVAEAAPERLPLTLLEKLQEGVWHQAQDTDFDGGFNKAKAMALAVVKQHQAEEHQNASNTTAAFQRLPSELAKALNYGAPMTAEDWVNLARVWNSRQNRAEQPPVQSLNTSTKCVQNDAENEHVCSEIPDNEHTVRDLAARMIAICLNSLKTDELVEITGERLCNLIRPYLRTTEPVMIEVSLEKCWQAGSRRVDNQLEICGDRPSMREITKAILNAAGVKYVD